MYRKCIECFSRFQCLLIRCVWYLHDYKKKRKKENENNMARTLMNGAISLRFNIHEIRSHVNNDLILSLHLSFPF